MKKSLNAIKDPVKEEFKIFEKHFKDSMKSTVPLLDRITYYIVQRKGKQIRPMLVLLSAKAFGPINDSTYTAASLIELLHTASLVHDDVIDDAYKRRGFFSINALWKNKIAVLVGDYLLSKGLIMALENEEHQLLAIVSKAVKEMSEGELLQFEKARKLDIEEDIYFEIIRRKTASLLAAACSAGAYSVTRESVVKDQMWKFGETLGTAFQIKDDLFDFGSFDIGKPRGIDIKEKKLTLPLIYALRNAEKTQRKKMLSNIRRHNNNSKKVNEVIQFVRDSGGIEYATGVMNQYKEQALELLSELPMTESKESLIKLVDFVIDRKK